ncbi:sensor histidine kinase [Bacillus cereus]|nr:sensor histidine kinase [Bacillus cereus]
MKSEAKFSIRYKIMAGYLVIILFLLISFIMLNNQISNLQKSRNFIIEVLKFQELNCLVHLFLNDC